MYQLGESVAQDFERAVFVFQRGCEGGLPEACTNLAFMYETGSGVTQDPARAFGLYQAACEGGEMLACRGVLMGGQWGTEVGERFSKSGQIGDTETGVALSEAIIELPDLGIRVISDVFGRFELAGLPAGRHALRAESAGYEMVFGELEVPGDPDFLVLLTRVEVEDPLALGRVTGRVTEEGADQGLSDVEITVLGETQVRTISTGRGRFNLTDLEPGLAEIRFTRLGYAPRTAALIVRPGRAVELFASMSTDPIEVTVRSSFLERNGFYERADLGWGDQYTRRNLDAINPGVLSDVVRRTGGLRVVRNNTGNTVAVSARRDSFSGGGCVLPVYVDGLRVYNPDLDQYSPETIDAMEIYQGIGTPLRYSMLNPCGVVLIWTR
jgi:hypothetical protein